MAPIQHRRVIRMILLATSACAAFAVHAQPTLVPLAPVNAPGAVAAPTAAPLPPLGDVPALNLPTVPVGAQASSNQPAANAATGLPVLPTATPEVTGVASAAVIEQAPQGTKAYSFGNADLSILFLPEQITKMKDAIRSFEDSGQSAAPPVAVVPQLSPAPVQEVIEDPLIYPVFYLASIAYDSPDDWSVWVSGYKITSHRNDTDISVVNITPDRATFVWNPSFSKAIARRNKEKLFASVDKVKNKIAAASSVSINDQNGAVSFTLKPNQSFAVGYFHVFEGYIETPTLTALPITQPPTNVAGNALPGAE